MKIRRLTKFLFLSGILLTGIWFYLTEYQKFRVRRIFDQVYQELVSGRMDENRIESLESDFSRISHNAVFLSVRKYADSYADQYPRGGHMKFAAGILIGKPGLKWANGIGRSTTIPLCIMLLEDSKNHPSKTRSHMENIACTLLPKATKQSFGMEGEVFVGSEMERSIAICQWNEWYQANKFAILERDQKIKKEVDEHIGHQKKFVEGLLKMNDTGK